MWAFSEASRLEHPILFMVDALAESVMKHRVHTASTVGGIIGFQDITSMPDIKPG